MMLPNKDGIQWRKFYEQVQKQTPEPVPELVELDSAPIPELLQHVYDVFMDLSMTRGFTESGPLPISYSDIIGWMTITGIGLHRWETNLIRQMDSIFISAVLANNKKNRGK